MLEGELVIERRESSPVRRREENRQELTGGEENKGNEVLNTWTINDQGKLPATSLQNVLFSHLMFDRI